MVTTNLVIRAAREVAYSIDECYDGYRANLISRFGEILFDQQSENSALDQRRAVKRIVEAFATEVQHRMVDKS